MKNHKYADLFPMMEGEALAAHVADIKEHGQREPIVIFDGQILDGRNRWKACMEVGVEPKTRVHRGSEESALALVVSLNLKRRQLDESQRDMVAARIANMRQGARTDLPPIGGMLKPVVSQTEAAGLCNVSVRGVQRAAAVIRDGGTELIAAVDQGRIPVSVAAKIALEDKSVQARLVARVEDDGAKPHQLVSDLRRQDRVVKLAEIAKGDAPLAAGQTAARYPLIYADPPWRYEHAESESRAIENQYPTMTLDDICALPLGDITTDDAILFMWATSPKLDEGMRVVREWGFTYRTCMVWDKEKIGMGYYARQQHELLLIATKGSIPVPPPAARPGSVVRIARGEHSAKPHEFYELIERMYPELPKLEMFCRSPRAGWSVWGNQSRAA